MARPPSREEKRLNRLAIEWKLRNCPFNLAAIPVEDRVLRRKGVPELVVTRRERLKSDEMENEKERERERPREKYKGEWIGCWRKGSNRRWILTSLRVLGAKRRAEKSEQTRVREKALIRRSQRREMNFVPRQSAALRTLTRYEREKKYLARDRCIQSFREEFLGKIGMQRERNLYRKSCRCTFLLHVIIFYSPFPFIYRFGFTLLPKSLLRGQFCRGNSPVASHFIISFSMFTWKTMLLDI